MDYEALILFLAFISLAAGLGGSFCCCGADRVDLLGFRRFGRVWFCLRFELDAE
jgi:hypothetical protein